MFLQKKIIAKVAISLIAVFVMTSYSTAQYTQAVDPGIAVNEIGMIKATSTDSVWMNPYSGAGNIFVAAGTKYNNQLVQIVREAKTTYGTYEQFIVNGHVVGWLDKRAFSSITPAYNNAVNKAGVIKAASTDSVWVNPYAGGGNVFVAAGAQYNNQLVQIVREAKTAYGTYEQFTMNGHVVGWLDKRAFSAIGQVNYNNAVNNIGQISAASYDGGIWSDPYLGPGSPYVTQASKYNGKQVLIVREAQTNYGTYEQFTVNGQIMGWLDKRAFSSITPAYNNAVNKAGVIKAASTDSVWVNPYAGGNNIFVAAGAKYNNQLVQIVREAKTAYGIYEQFTVNGHVVGWLDKKAFSAIGQVNYNNAVNNIGQISAASYDGIWSDPYLGPGSPYVTQASKYNGQRVQIVREAQTNYGTYEQFTVNNHVVGWLDKRAFLSSNPLESGIDIASYQNDAGSIDFNLVKQSGINFVITKATEGTTYLNPYFFDDITAEKKAGLKTSAYHFFRAENSTEAQNEADYFAKQITEAQIDGYAFVDVETTNNSDPSTLTNNVNVFLNELRNKGITKIGIYSNKDFLDSSLYLSSIRLNNPNLLVWVAWYSGNPNTDLWQSTNTGSVNGITGSVDLDFSYAYRF